MGPKMFWARKVVGAKQIFGVKNFLGPKNFWVKKFGGQKNKVPSQLRFV